MGTDKALNMGNGPSGAKDYPSDWPCKLCGKILSEHVQIGTPNEDNYGKAPATNNWCYSAKDLEMDIGYEHLKSADYFSPIDNLTYVEMKANERQLS